MYVIQNTHNKIISFLYQKCKTFAKISSQNNFTHSSSYTIFCDGVSKFNRICFSASILTAKSTKSSNILRGTGNSDELADVVA